MRLELIPDRNTVTITPNGPKERYGKETAFWHALKKQLIADGHDVIKKCPVKDKKFCHMFGDKWTFYVRSRKPGKGTIRSFYVYDRNYAIRALHIEFNQAARAGESITLSCDWDVFGERTAFACFTCGTEYEPDDTISGAVVCRICNEPVCQYCHRARKHKHERIAAAI